MPFLYYIILFIIIIIIILLFICFLFSVDVIIIIILLFICFLFSVDGVHLLKHLLEQVGSLLRYEFIEASQNRLPDCSRKQLKWNSNYGDPDHLYSPKQMIIH
jgi:c-di-AMP phosphodiesterase-like protein